MIKIRVLVTNHGRLARSLLPYGIIRIYELITSKTDHKYVLESNTINDWMKISNLKYADKQAMHLPAQTIISVAFIHILFQCCLSYEIIPYLNALLFFNLI